MRMNRDKLLGWFGPGGVAWKKAAAALDELKASAADGWWAPGAARRVTAALNKQTMAIKVARAGDAELDRWSATMDWSEARPVRDVLWPAAHEMRFGGYVRAAKTDPTELRAAAKATGSADLARFVERFCEWREDWLPVAELVTSLNAARPKPTFTELGCSPTITRTVTELGLAVEDPKAIRVCPIRWEKLKKERDGKTVEVWVGILLWPAGTRHGESRHNTGGCCQACGHRIRNPYNWVPLVATTKTGPASLWVGRDCAGGLPGLPGPQVPIRGAGPGAGRAGLLGWR